MLSRFGHLIAFVSLLLLAAAGFALCVTSAFGAPVTTGRVQEVLTLPNGAVVMPLRTEDFIRTGAPGAWGGQVHERTGRTQNDQFNLADPAHGSFINSGGIGGLRLSGRADDTGTFSLVIGDAWDQRPTTAFATEFRGRGEGGNWGTLGTFSLTEREASGTKHIVEITGLSPGQRVVTWFKQVSRKVRSGDIFDVTQVVRPACKS